MNRHHLLTLLLAILPSLLPATDRQLYTYEGEVAGVVCSACSSRVKAALSRLEGVTAVKITLGKDGGAPRLEISSTSPSLTSEAAVKALGDDAKMYHIRNLKLQRN